MKEIFSCVMWTLRKIEREVGGREAKWQRLRGRFRWALCVLLGDHWSVPFPPPNGQGCWSASFHLFKIHTQACTGTRIYTCRHGIHDPQPQFPDTPLYPAWWSLHLILSKQMRSWLRLKLPVLPVYPVHHLFSSCSHAHLCNICVWVCLAIYPSVYAMVLTDLLRPCRHVCMRFCVV